MTKMIRLVIFALCCLTVAACSSSQNTQNNNEPYQRKIYLTEQDYLDDLAKSAELERREAKPAAESEYIFDILPETQKNVYFFDERVQPMVPGEPSEREYKNTKRLWQKPKRYTPEQYYGSQPQTDTSSSDSYSNDYDY